MKAIPLFLASALVLIATNARAQSYALDWFTIDGGGGTSSNATYTLSGTIGQPDAGGPMTNALYSLTGGFWSVVVAVQTPGAPLLTVTSSNNVVTVSWPAPAEGWRLQSTANLITTGSVWTEIPPPYPSSGGIFQYSERMPAGSKFYRLHKP